MENRRGLTRTPGQSPAYKPVVNRANMMNSKEQVSKYKRKKKKKRKQNPASFFFSIQCIAFLIIFLRVGQFSTLCTQPMSFCCDHWHSHLCPSPSPCPVLSCLCLKAFGGLIEEPSPLSLHDATIPGSDLLDVDLHDNPTEWNFERI